MERNPVIEAAVSTGVTGSRLLGAILLSNPVVLPYAQYALLVTRTAVALPCHSPKVEDDGDVACLNIGDDSVTVFGWRRPTKRDNPNR